MEAGGEKMGGFGKFSKFWGIFENFLINMYDPVKSEKVNWLMHIKMQKLKIVMRRGLRSPKPLPDRKPGVEKKEDAGIRSPGRWPIKRDAGKQNF